MTSIADHQDFERRLQSIAQAVMLALMLGIGYALIDLTKSSSRQEVTNAQTSKDISELKNELGVLRAQGTNAALAASNAATAAALAASKAASEAALAASTAAMAASLTVQNKSGLRTQK